MGEVVAVGPGKTDDNGKLVADGRQGRRQGPLRQVLRPGIPDGWRDYLHMREDDIIGIVG